MRKKLWFLIIVDTVVVVAFILAVLRWLKKEPPAEPPPPSPAPISPTTPETINTGSIEGVPLATQLNAPNNTVEQDVQVMQGLVNILLTTVKEPYRPPLGDNNDVTKAMTGQNRMHKVFISTNHPAVRNGELVDRWGTPYFFHALSANALEIRSAGPDKKLFTDDDTMR